MPSFVPTEAEDNNELLAALEEQIKRLPWPYREVLLLCWTQGMTYDEVARELGCSATTVDRRVACAEQLIRKQLNHCGFALSGRELAMLLSQSMKASAMPAYLLGDTVRNALAFVNNTLAPSRVVWISQIILQSMEATKSW